MKKSRLRFRKMQVEVKVKVEEILNLLQSLSLLHALASTFFITLTFLYGCGQVGQEETTSVSISFKVPSTNQKVLQTAVPTGITSITLEVTATDMQDIIREVGVTEGQTVTIDLEVPSGPLREFKARAFNNDNTVIYEGKTTVDLVAGVPTTAQIDMIPLFGGLPDTGFGINGKVTTPVGTGNDGAAALAIQADGKIVVAGRSFNGSDYDFAVVRYNIDGTPDTGFDADGKVTTAIGSSDDGAAALAIQADGRVVVAGRSFNGSDDDLAVVRYNIDGTLDTSFDTDGIVTTDIGGSNNGALAIAIQSDGKIVVAGRSFNGIDWDFALARYKTDGTLDAGFGIGGKVTTAIGSSSHDLAAALDIQSDGKIIVAGGSFNGSDYDFALVRYNTNGSLDTGFGTGGKVTTPIGAGNDAVFALTIQTDGKIVVAGYSFDPVTLGEDIALARYWP